MTTPAVSAWVPTLEHPDYRFVRLLALTWVANETLAPSLVQSSASKALADMLSESTDVRPLLIDCRGIDGSHDYAFQPLKAVLSKWRGTIAFSRATALARYLDSDLGPPQAFDAATGSYVFGSPIDSTRLAQLLASAEDLPRDHIRRSVAQSFRGFSDGLRRLASTPLLASGAFDARAVMSDPRTFVWLGIELADRLSAYLEKSQPERFRLLAVSLRASPIAAAMGVLTQNAGALEIVDHLGPKYRLIEEHRLGPQRRQFEYIYVGDFIVGGTELKTANAYARSLGGRVKQAFVIGTLLSPGEYGNEISIERLVALRDAVPNATYSFAGHVP